MCVHVLEVTVSCGVHVLTRRTLLAVAEALSLPLARPSLETRNNHHHSGWALKQHLDGEVVGYRGARVISLKGSALSSVDIPVTKAMYQHLDSRNFDEAYAIACLGVPQVEEHRSKWPTSRCRVKDKALVEF